MTATVLSTPIEVEQRAQSLDDQKPEVSGPTVVRRFFIPPPHHSSLAVYIIQITSVFPISEYLRSS